MEANPSSNSKSESEGLLEPLQLVRLLSQSILNSSDLASADQRLVDGVRSLSQADRVSLLDSRLQGKPVVLAISNSLKIDPNSDVVVALLRFASLLTDHAPSDDQLKAYTLSSGAVLALVVPVDALPPIANTPNANTGYTRSLILEWLQPSGYVQSKTLVQSAVPLLIDAWQFRTSRNHRRSSGLRWYHWCSAIAALLSVIVIGLSRAELTIVVQGTLQPTEQRFVFAPSEGYVASIAVTDGQKVSQGDSVATLESPSLQMLWSQTVAEIGLVQQKKDGINLTLNQIKPTDDQATLIGSRLAGEVQELEAKQSNLLDQKKFYENEIARLRLVSPIVGTVIAWDVEKFLENRPVRRGETLMRIASLEGRWQIDASVVDWEAGYVVSAFRACKSNGMDLSASCVFATDSGKPLLGQIKEIGSSMYDVKGSQQVDMRIELEEIPVEPRIGTSATISIGCGNYPRWFIWTRSILDGLHRRFWF